MEYEKAKPHLIAYIDILGTSEMLASQDYDKFYKAVQDAYQCWIAISKLENTIKVKTFSDNIVFAHPFEDETKEEKFIKIRDFLNMVYIFQDNLLMENGMLVRGGICIGDLILNDVLVLGPGLIEAYFLESHIATYPRIVVSDAFYKTAQSLIPEKILELLIQTDMDGVKCINFLMERTAEKAMKIADFCDKKIVEQMNKLNPNLKAIQKYAWLKTLVKDR